MTTTTQSAALTLPTTELRSILAALNEYTSKEQHRPALQLAQVRPIIVEQRTQSAGIPVDLTDAMRIDPAALITSMKAIGKNTNTQPDTTLTLTEHTWQLTNGQTTSSGQHTQHEWPNTFGLWQDQRAALAPHSIGAPMLTRLAKLAKHLGTDQVNAETMAHTNDQPDPRRPIVYTITSGHIDARVLIMPRRRN